VTHGLAVGLAAHGLSTSIAGLGDWQQLEQSDWVMSVRLSSKGREEDHLPPSTPEQVVTSSPVQQESFWLTPQALAAWPTVVVSGFIRPGLADGAATTAATKVAAMARNCILTDLVGWEKRAEKLKFFVEE
jgi:hypothetical protein